MNETINLWIQDSSILCCSSDDHQQNSSHIQSSTTVVKRFLDTNVHRHQMVAMMKKYNMQNNSDIQIIWNPNAQAAAKHLIIQE